MPRPRGGPDFEPASMDTESGRTQSPSGHTARVDTESRPPSEQPAHDSPGEGPSRLQGGNEMSQSPRHLLEGSLGTGVRAGRGGAGASFLMGTAGPSAPHLLEVSSNPTAARKPSAPTSLQATPGHPALRFCKVVAPSPERPQPVSGIASRKGQQQPWAVVSLRPSPGRVCHWAPGFAK